MTPRGQKPPGLLIAFLIAIVAARIGIVFVVDSPLTTALAWATLLAALGVGTLLKRARAASALAWLCIVLGIDTLLQLAFVDVPVVHLVAAVSWAVLALGVGAYLLRSRALKRFLDEASAS